MGEFLDSINPARIYAVCSLVGAGIFLLRIVLMLIGIGGADLDVDVHVDLDGLDGAHIPDGDVDVDAHGALDADLHLLSVQGISAFIMMFGLTGWGMTHGNVAGAVIILVLSLVMGLFTMFLVGKLFQMAMRLQSSGTVTLQSAGGQEGTVYLTIKPGGTGKVQVRVGQALQVVDAVSEDAEAEIKTGERVMVQYTTDGRTLVVKKIQDAIGAS